MIEMLELNLYQAIAWTALTFLVSMLYKHFGYVSGMKEGIQEMLIIFNHHEREATQRVLKKLKQERTTNAEAN